MKNLLILLFLPLFVFAQDDVFSIGKINKDSEKIFNNFGRLGVSIGLHDLKWNNSPNSSIDYSVSSDVAPSLGIDYNFYQTGQFNFRVGFFVRYHNVVTEYKFDPGQTILGREFRSERADAPYWNYHLPVSVEYNKFLFKDFAVSFYGGFEFMYYGVSPQDTIAQLSIDNTPLILLRETETSNNLTWGLNVGAGFYFKAGTLLMRFDTKFHLHAGQNIIAKEVVATNLLDTPDGRSFHNWSGKYVSFNLTIHPQNWFKRKAD
jgi:hypothetical protein